MDYRIAMFWARGQLSFLELLSMMSFVRLGYTVELYTYDNVSNSPPGVTLCSANDIQQAETSADRFAWQLLAKLENRIWVAPDIVGISPFVVRDGYLLGWADEYSVSSSVVAVPRNSPALQAMCDRASDQDWSLALQESGEISHAQPEEVFHPYSAASRQRLLQSNPRRRTRSETDATCGINLHADWIRPELKGIPGAIPHPDSRLGNLITEFGIDPSLALLPNTQSNTADNAAAKHYRKSARRNDVAPAQLPTGDIRPLDSVVAVTTMRNEGPFILDWVAYHLAVGITHFLVYTNDCDDPTVEILEALEKRGVVTRIENPIAKGERPPRAALKAAAKHSRVKSADAVVVLDVDEYINVHTGDGT
ncbi:MAG: glycosyltransferase family 2 protein, partial [Boseongicola sp.]